MNPWLVIAGAILLVPFAGAYWFGQIRAAWQEREVAAAAARKSRSLRHQEEAERAGMELTRDVALSLVSFGALFAVIGTYLSKVNTPNVKGDDMPELAQRIIIAVLAFAIIYGLAAPVVAEMLPDKGTRKSRVLSELIGALVAAVFAISAGTTNSIYRSIQENIVSNASKIVATFLGIMFTAIGVFLVWKRVSTTFRPVGKVDKRGPLRSAKPGNQ